MQKRILDLFKLNGHVALIIGGNRGLGLSMAKALAEAGASISIAARDEKINETAIKEIQSENDVEAIANYCDVTQESSIKEVVAKTIERFGK